MVSKSLTSISLFIITSLWAFALQAASKLDVSVDRNPVMERESFVLQIVANDSVDGRDLDLSPLDNIGFIVGRTATSSQTQIINGSISKTTTWSVVLVAKSAGTYTIPSLRLNGLVSEPIEVKVIKASNQTGQNNEPIFLKNTIESNELYLQQTVKLVSRLYFSPQVELQSGSLSDPVLDGAFIKQQGKDKDTSEIIMGVRYRVIERVYTVTPQASGQFIIKSPTFSGEIATGNRRRFFSGFGQTKPVTAFGDDLTITVNPIPEDYTGTWLASELVQLNEEWQPNKTQFEVGEAITRTFTLTALNVNQEQLPPVAGDYPSVFKVYPDQSESHEVLRQNALVAQRISSEAIVANQPGTFTIPQVKVSWFNTKTKRQEFATLPARDITIVPATTDAQQPAITNVLPEQMGNIEAQQCEAGTAPNLNHDAEKPSHWYHSPLFIFGGWVLFAASAVFAFVQGRTGANKTREQTPHSIGYDIHQLRNACKGNEPKKAREALIQWGQAKFGNVANLKDLQTHVPAALQREIRRLNLSQYSNERTEWQGAEMWRLIVQFDQESKASDNSNSPLPPLN